MHTFRIFAIAAFAAIAAIGQSTPVTIEQSAPLNAVSIVNKYSGSNLAFQCRAKSTQRLYDFAAVSQFTSVVVLTNVGTVTTTVNHGLSVGNKVTLAGSATTALNGVYVIATVPSATTFTVATSGVSNATYADLTSLATTAPRTSAPIWSVEKFLYDGSNNLLQTQWAGPGNTGASQICDNTATLSFN